MTSLLFVTLCAWKFPSNPSQSPHPKHWHLSVYWHSSFSLAKASKVRADLRGTWFETQQWQRAVIKSMFYTRFYTSKDEKSMKNQHKPTHFLPKKARKSRKCRRRLPRLRAAAGAHCVTRKSVGERSWWQNKWWKSMERWESMEIIHNIHWYTATRYIILYNDI